VSAALPQVAPPKRSELDPIEIASRDEIAALQLQRLQATLRHAYDNVAHFRGKCESMDVHPGDL
jgi:phenylacetate-CoA ligase